LEHEAIAGKVVGDFCSGTCMYSVASMYFEPEKVVAFELDPDAINVANENLAHYELIEKVTIENKDILQVFEDASTSPYLSFFDTIIMNPPFGTKSNEGIDMKLLVAASKALKPQG